MARLLNVDDTSFYQHTAEMEGVIRMTNTANTTDKTDGKNETKPVLPPSMLQKTPGGFI